MRRRAGGRVHFTMLQNLKQIEGRALDARDGTIGEVKDVLKENYFVKFKRK